MALIELSHLQKVYQTDPNEAPTVALREVDCMIEKGEFVSIVGPSGSGKSTLLQILGLLDRPSSGSYRFLGKPVDEYDDDAQAHIRNTSMGFIFQSFNLLARTSVLENVKLPLAYSSMPTKEWDAHATKQIEAVGLGHRITHEPAQLSGGERQRVAIARALVNDPEIIFADEPTGNLDSKAGAAVLDMLESLHEKGHTVVLITHDKVLAKRADRIIFIRDGVIEWDGPSDQFTQ
jgi:putative ABC transport system ATP-binding protein